MRKRIEETRLVSFGNAKPYKPMSAAAMRLVQPPEMLIEDFMSAGFVCGLTSLAGTGKTWLALEIARAVATGGKVMGQFAVPRGASGVLFVGSDSSVADYARQWTRLTQEQHDLWEGTFDAGVDEPPPSPFERIQFLIQSPFMLDNQDEVKRVILTALNEALFPRETATIGGEEVVSERGGCALIVMDTLSRLTSANQNDNTEMERVFANVRVICEVTGAAVLLLHHNSKMSEYNDGTDWRGATSQIGALDAWIQLTGSKKDKHKIKAEFKKFRGITPASFEYQQQVSDEDKAKLVYLGDVQGFFGKDAIKDDLLLQFTDWKSLAAAEEALYSSYSDQYERPKFHTACKNRLNQDLKELLDRRGKGVKGSPHEYKTKTQCPSNPTPTTTPDAATPLTT